jgi:hypothetical protein
MKGSRAAPGGAYSRRCRIARTIRNAACGDTERALEAPEEAGRRAAAQRRARCGEQRRPGRSSWWRQVEEVLGWGRDDGEKIRDVL